MNAKDNKQILIEKYFAKELDVAEIKEFEALLANDPDFKEEVKAHAYARISIQQEGNKLLKEKLNQMGQKIQQEKTSRRDSSGADQDRGNGSQPVQKAKSEYQPGLMLVEKGKDLVGLLPDVREFSDPFLTLRSA